MNEPVLAEVLKPILYKEWAYPEIKKLVLHLLCAIIYVFWIHPKIMDLYDRNHD